MSSAQDRETLNRLMRDHGDMLGTSRATVVALNAFISAVTELRCTEAEIRPLLAELSDAIRNMEPRIPALIHLTKEFEKEIEPSFEKPLAELKRDAARILGEKISKFQEKVEAVTEIGIDYVKDGDVILVHSASNVVINILVRAKAKKNRSFSTIVLKQDFQKTRQLIQALSGCGVPLQVVPEYALSHHIASANKLFIGAVSVTEDRKAVTTIGTGNVVGMCHVHNVPVYLFVNSYKFSRFPSSSQRIHRKEETVCFDDLEFCFTTHSHSIIDLDLVDYFITEHGEMGQSSYSEFLL